MDQVGFACAVPAAQHEQAGRFPVFFPIFFPVPAACAVRGPPREIAGERQRPLVLAVGDERVERAFLPKGERVDQGGMRPRRPRRSGQAAPSKLRRLFPFQPARPTARKGARIRDAVGERQVFPKDSARCFFKIRLKKVGKTRAEKTMGKEHTKAVCFGFPLDIQRIEAHAHDFFGGTRRIARAAFLVARLDPLEQATAQEVLGHGGILRIAGRHS